MEMSPIGSRFETTQARCSILTAGVSPISLMICHIGFFHQSRCRLVGISWSLLQAKIAGLRPPSCTLISDSTTMASISPSLTRLGSSPVSIPFPPNGRTLLMVSREIFRSWLPFRRELHVVGECQPGPSAVGRHACSTTASGLVVQRGLVMIPVTTTTLLFQRMCKR